MAVSKVSEKGPFKGVPFTKCSGGTSISSTLPGKASELEGRRDFLFIRSIKDIIDSLYFL